MQTIAELAVLSVLSVLATLAPPIPAQFRCPDQGSLPVPAHIEAGPPLGCALAPEWPAWHLYTPGHRAVVSKAGFQQGEARAAPRLILTWRCTGWLLVPAVPDRLRTMGYVLDVDEVSCSG